MNTRNLGIRCRWAAFVLMGVFFAQPVQALDGGVSFDFPAGAIACSYKIYDKDIRGNDLLESGTKDVPPNAEPTDMVTVGLGNLFCKDYVVQGPAGSSGEPIAEVLVEVTWTFESGNTSVQSQERRLTCPQKSGPPKLAK